MGGSRRKFVGFFAGVLACLALALAVPLVAGAASSLSLLGSFVYEDVYGVFGGNALMAKTVGTVTDEEGYELNLVQEDLVNPEKGVILSTVRTDAYVVDDPRISEFTIGGKVLDYFWLDSTYSSEQGEGKRGLLSFDGEVVLDPVYDILQFNGDQTLIIATRQTESGATATLLDAATLKVLGEEPYSGASQIYAYFYVEDGVEFVYLSVYLDAGRPEGHVFAVSGAGFGEELSEWGGERLPSVTTGVSSTGEEFGAYVNSEGTLVIERESGTKEIAGQYYEYGYYVYGDYIEVMSLDGKSYFSYTGEPTTIFDGYSVADVLTVDSSYVYYCNESNSWEYVLIQGDGSVRELPEGYRYGYDVVDNHLFGYTEGGEFAVFDANMRKVLAYDVSQFGGDAASSFLSEWDKGFIIYCSVDTGDGYQGYNIYFDKEFNLVAEGFGTTISRAANYATLPDGTEIYLRKDGNDSDYALVLGADLQPVEFGGYQLVIPGNPGSEQHYSDNGNSVQRAGTDWYYARDPETGKFGAVDPSGTVVIPFEFDSIVDCNTVGDETMILVRKGDTWSFLDTAQATEPDASFSDVTAETPHVEDILWLEQTGISTGWEEEDGTVTFRGMSPVVRQDMAAFLYRLAGSPDYEPTAEDMAYFSDVDGDTPHFREVLWLAATGISEGWEEGDSRVFRGMSEIVRQDMAAFLYRLAGSPDYEPTAEDMAYFSDVDESTPHYREVLWLYSTGVSEGWEEKDGSHTFRGMDTVKRQDMAAFLHRMSERGLVG